MSHFVLALFEGPFRCAEKIILTGFTLLTDATPPLRLKLGESKDFFNVQFNGGGLRMLSMELGRFGERKLF